MSNNNDPNKKNNDEDDKKPSNDYYVGNGQAVMAPPPPAGSKRPPPAPGGDNNVNGETVASLFNKAFAPNEMPPEDDDGNHNNTTGAPPRAGEAFSGVGRRLGFNADTPSPAIDDGRPVEVIIRVTFYRNGFTIDDGPLLDPKSGEGKEVLEAFDKGVVPEKISGKHPRRAKFDVHLVKKEKEDYVKQFSAFEGAGRTLSNDHSSSNNIAAAANVAAVALTVSPDAPRGRVLFQMPDGNRRRVDTNPTVHTVSELFGEAAVATGVSTSRISLTVREGPGRTVSLEAGDTRTLKDAKVDGAAIFVAINQN